MTMRSAAISAFWTTQPPPRPSFARTRLPHSVGEAKTQRRWGLLLGGYSASAPQTVLVIFAATV
jgi:hypothetical protein